MKRTTLPLFWQIPLAVLGCFAAITLLPVTESYGATTYWEPAAGDKDFWDHGNLTGNRPTSSDWAGFNSAWLNLDEDPRIRDANRTIIGAIVENNAPKQASFNINVTGSNNRKLTLNGNSTGNVSIDMTNANQDLRFRGDLPP